MKKALCFIFILLITPLAAFAAQTGKLGLGITAGEPFGPTLAYWLDERRAFDLGYGFNHDGILYGDYLWHGWGLGATHDEGRLGLYTGIGGRFENVEKGDDKYAVRIPLGINYILNHAPIEFFGEVVPVLQFEPEGDLDLDASIGARYYFTVR